MFKQLYFPGLEPRQPRDNLFFGILSPANSAIEISKAADDLRNLYGLNGRLIAQERLHVSLHAVGRFDGLPNFIIERAHEAGELVSTSPFPLMFDRVMSFDIKRDKRPFVLRPGHDLASLFTLHDVLGEAMKRAKIGRYVMSRFVPHMTLLYDRRVVRERPIEPIRMNVRDFVLVHSLVGQSRYIELARWPLRGLIAT
jgi:RNA 2',3'-cyclic 3'-phosphodiesterase